ncbi:hypothetical protein KBB60_01720, partial [Patescibacteria group bacterium]|nr:hypothetical protein [Patescibacteria group bacterium]
YIYQILRFVSISFAKYYREFCTNVVVYPSPFDAGQAHGGRGKAALSGVNYLFTVRGVIPENYFRKLPS